MSPSAPTKSKPALPASSGEALTAGRIFLDFASRVRRLARLYLGNDADAEDATGEVFLQVVRKLPTFRGESAFSTWLTRVAINAILAYRRRRALRRRRETCLPPEGAPEADRHAGSRESGPLSALIAWETSEQLDRAIAGLPAIYREVLVLADVEDRPNHEIAGLLHLSLPAVKSRLHRARLLLRCSLGPGLAPATAPDNNRPRHQGNGVAAGRCCAV
jgi:RNA polymerase sigma-70 factor (ECF subfamily)